MKYVTKPAPFAVGNLEFRFDDLVKYLIENDQRFNSSGPGIRAGLRIEDELARCKDLPYVGPLAPEHCAILAAAAEEPSAGYPVFQGKTAQGEAIRVAVSRQLLPYLEAIKDAADAPPMVCAPETEPQEEPAP